ncbi:MAG: M48 family metallopeptidase [Bacilli bacterium]
MKFKIDNDVYDVVIKKKDNKYSYIRVKEDLKIYINTSKEITDKKIKELLEENQVKIKGFLDKEKKKKNESLMFLGNPFDIVFVPSIKEPSLEEGILLINDLNKLDSFYKKMGFRICQERLDFFYNIIEEKIPYPQLKLRKMKTRWGVCNRKNNSITLNLELLKKEIKFLDYVLVHELCHFVHFNHSKDFWLLVSKYIKDYKKLRKEIKE